MSATETGAFRGKQEGGSWCLPVFGELHDNVTRRLSKDCPTEILNKDEKCALLEAAHSGYDRLTNPVRVPSELHFMVRWHDHGIKVKRVSGARPIQEYSPIKGCLVAYSSIQLKPNRSLMLSAIWCLTKDQDVDTKHEVIIKAAGEGATWSKSVIAYASYTQSSNRAYKYLRFHEQHLEAEHEYILKVEKHGSECEEGEGFTARCMMSPITKTPSQVGLEVTDNKANSCVSFIGVRLV